VCLIWGCDVSAVGIGWGVERSGMDGGRVMGVIDDDQSDRPGVRGHVDGVRGL
jgi:hypothetical protein